jgi:osmotically inducible lipoprotein OsmB
MRATSIAAVLGAVLMLGGCATWDGMERSERGLAVGATGGAVVGGVLGGPLGAAIGAGVGGYAGHHEVRD